MSEPFSKDQTGRVSEADVLRHAIERMSIHAEKLIAENADLKKRNEELSELVRLHVELD